jgi:putative phage-type endonuclease
MVILDIDQGTPEWHVWRAGGIGASNADAIIDWPYAHETARALWMIRTGRKPACDLSKNIFVLRGQRYEPLARNAMETFVQQHYGFRDLAIPTCVQHDEYDFIRVSLDGMLSNGIPTELKVPCWENFERVLRDKRQSEPFQRYYPQVQDQMLATGADVGFLGFYRVYDNRLIAFEVKRDQNFIDKLIEKQAWWWDLYKRDVPPPITARDLFEPQQPEQQVEWVTLATELRNLWISMGDAEPRIKAAKAKEAELKKKLVAIMGQCDRGEYAGIKLNRSLRSGNIDYTAYFDAVKKMIHDKGIQLTLPDPDEYRKQGSESIRVTPVDYLSDGGSDVPLFEYY